MRRRSRLRAGSIRERDQVKAASAGTRGRVGAWSSSLRRQPAAIEFTSVGSIGLGGDGSAAYPSGLDSV